MNGAVLRRAVVIEDDEQIRSLITTVLERAGLTVDAVSNGPDGISKVRELDPVVVTVDIRMPGMDGIETTRRIRAISEVFIVMVSARTSPGDRIDSLDSGADAYLTKPFRPRELHALVTAQLSALNDA